MGSIKILDEAFYQEQSEKMLKSSNYIYSKDFTLDFFFSFDKDIDFDIVTFSLEMSKAKFHFKIHWGTGYYSPLDMIQRGEGYFHLDFNGNLILYFSEIYQQDLNIDYEEFKTNEKFASQAFINCKSYDDLINVKQIDLKFSTKKYLVTFYKQNGEFQPKTKRLPIKLYDIEFQYQ